MKKFRMYVRPGKELDLGRMRERLSKKHNMGGAKISEFDTDPLGTYLTFEIPDTVTAKELKRYRGVKNVLDVTESIVPSLFKIYPSGDVINSFDDMWDRYGLEIKKSGTEKAGMWPFRTNRDYMILEGTESVHPQQIAAYDGIRAAERIDQYIVDIAFRAAKGKPVPEMTEGLTVSY